MVPMRDGVRLTTDVYRPKTDEPVPVLLLRTPYSKQDVQLVHTTIFEPLAAVERGFAVVVQDARGGWGASEGEFEPIFPERNDGHDAVDWLTSNSWCNGSVGIYGASFMGINALQAIVDAPSALKACVAYICPASFHDNYWYYGGAFEVGARLNWSFSDATRRWGRLAGRFSAEELKAIGARIAAFRADPAAFYASDFDPTALPGPVSAMIPYFTNNLSHPSDDVDYWGRGDVISSADRVNLSVLYIAGWYDTFIKSGVDLFQALSEKSPEAVRNSHSLLVGPWEHSAYLGSMTLSSAGQRNFGGAAAGGQAALQSVVLGWFEKRLKGDAGDWNDAGVKYFHIGPDRWEESSTWPPAEVTEQRWYLHSGGRAQTYSGDGVLEPEKPVGSQMADSYVYDPRDPAPVHGGRTLLFSLPSGVQDQRVIQERRDVLVYTSAAMQESLTVKGNVLAELHVSSSAPTTDFFVVLSDVYPDGRAENVAEGMLRLPVVDVAAVGEVRSITIDLQDTAYTFPVGHCLRLHITSSCFPRFDRNRNLAPGSGSPSDFTIAAQRVHHDPEHLSALVLECASS
jgi:putative CocE/NonD family hydrolase